MSDPLVKMFKDENVGVPKRYNLSVKAKLYKDIMQLAEEVGDELGTNISAAKIVEGCVELYKQQRAHDKE